MGDLSAEPSMEDILSSIKRIIAEDGEERPMRARRTSVRAVPPPAAVDATDDDADEVLELSDPMPPAPAPAPPPVARAPAATTRDAAILSTQTAQAARGALDSLSRLLVKPEPDSDGTLEGLVREMLRPMLRDWLDANLPALVETIVAREIEKITGTR